MLEYRLADRLHLGAGNLVLKLVIILKADLLNAREGIPPELDDIVEVSPTSIVELTRGGLGYAPYIIEESEYG